MVCCGLIYGQEENIFHNLFKMAWHNVDLPVYGNGRNILPTIHINDLAGVIQNIADQKPKVKYIIAVDDSKSSLKQITKAVSKNLGTGKVKVVQKEDALLDREITVIYSNRGYQIESSSILSKYKFVVLFKAS